MTNKQKEAFENLQRIAMDHVRIAATIDNAIQEVRREIDDNTPEYLELFIRAQQRYVNDYKKVVGNDLNVREFEAWKDLLSTISTEEES